MLQWTAVSKVVYSDSDLKPLLQLLGLGEFIAVFINFYDFNFDNLTWLMYVKERRTPNFNMTL